MTRMLGLGADMLASMMCAVNRGSTAKTKPASERGSASIAVSQEIDCRIDLHSVPNEAEHATSHDNDADQVAAHMPAAGDGVSLMLHSRFRAQQTGLREEEQQVQHEHHQPDVPAPHNPVLNTHANDGMFLSCCEC